MLAFAYMPFKNNFQMKVLEIFDDKWVLCLNGITEKYAAHIPKNYDHNGWIYNLRS